LLPEPEAGARATARRRQLRGRLALYIGLIASWAAASFWLIGDLVVIATDDPVVLAQRRNLLAGADTVVLLVALVLVVLILTRHEAGPVQSLDDGLPTRDRDGDADGDNADGDNTRRIQPRNVGELGDLAGAVNQMADQLNTHLAALSQQAFRDPLTQLPNRILFMDRLKRALMQARRRKCFVAVLYLDLDDFKAVNDTYGHDGGDALLVMFAARLQACLRAEDTAGRLGGDEFTVVIDGAASMERLVAILDRIVEQVSRPYDIQGHGVLAAASVGMAVSEHGNTTAEELMRRADRAMYRAKHNGKAQYAIYDRAIDEDVLDTTVDAPSSAAH
jgi:diguanylate cyclase (GGDEF)-like protein